MSRPGASLIAARQQKGLSLDQLATQLKVSPLRLQALEAERWEELPDAAYARALVTAVCRALDCPAAPILAEMPGVRPAALERVSEGLNQPLESRPWLSSRWSLGLIALIVVAGLGLSLWPQAWKWPLTGPEAPPALPLPASAAPSAQFEPAVALPQSATAPAVAPMVVQSMAPASVPDAEPARPVSAVAAAGPELLVQANASTWLSVQDAQGRSLSARTLVAGERVTLRVPMAPARVVLGNAPGAELHWRGQPVDLSAYAGARVARLNLK